MIRKYPQQKSPPPPPRKPEYKKSSLSFSNCNVRTIAIVNTYFTNRSKFKISYILCAFLFCPIPADQNSLQQQQRQKHISAGGLETSELDGKRNIFIFSISFKVLNEEMQKSDWDSNLTIALEGSLSF
jgi:hypothetical protein